MQGYLALVLHAHLPYVRHPEHPRFLEEDWLYEAVTESYLPLLGLMAQWRRDDLPWRLTLSLTPTLCAMLTDGLLCARIAAHLQRLSELSDRELQRTRGAPQTHATAAHYRAALDDALATWHGAHGDLVAAFRGHQDAGHLEIITSAATHGYLPLLSQRPRAAWGQIKTAVDDYARHFGRPPRGIWLPECAYVPGLDPMLRDAGLRYFIADAHGLLFAHPRPRFGSYAPIFCAESGVAAFGRDRESADQVWSRQGGYPGDPDYRELYRDIGFDLPLDYVAPYVQPTGERKNTGFKYHRITGPVDLGEKEPYDPIRAQARARVHADDFTRRRTQQAARLAAAMGRPPIIVTPYDAELFGHWWYEGPEFLDGVVRQACAQGSTCRLTHLHGYLSAHPTQQVAQPAASSWGDQGYHAYWLNERCAWLYPHLERAAATLEGLAELHEQATGLPARALNQATRELLLAQASDWAFIMTAGTMVEYAESRARSHLRRFFALADQVAEDRIDEAWLARLEATDNLFPAVDFRLYAPPG